ncbi:MAG: histidinol-phosphatase [Campylobacter sp.]|nr:histidinol-phosphatase [Campylobacter sp.]
MKVDLHNHTVLCNHASGTIDEYIQKAIENKTQIFGFSDHNPMNFDEKYRMSFAQMKDYENAVISARKRYEKDIKITLGYEVDFLQGYMDDRVLNAKVDHLIGSVHFIGTWGFDNPEFIGEYQNKDIDEIYRLYFECETALAKSGKFDIVGHFDLLKLFKFLPKTDIRILAKPALEAIKKANLVMEINSAGFRKPIGEQYPSLQILELMKELDIDITFGSDAHSPQQVGLNGEICEKIAKDLGYTQAVYFENRQRIKVKF